MLLIMLKCVKGRPYFHLGKLFILKITMQQWDFIGLWRIHSRLWGRGAERLHKIVKPCFTHTYCESWASIQSNLKGVWGEIFEVWKLFFYENLSSFWNEQNKFFFDSSYQMHLQEPKNIVSLIQFNSPSLLMLTIQSLLEQFPQQIL